MSITSHSGSTASTTNSSAATDEYQELIDLLQESNRAYTVEHRFLSYEQKQQLLSLAVSVLDQEGFSLEDVQDAWHDEFDI